MWQRGLLILLAVICINAETKLDINYACTRPGDVIPNPLDCGSYFICGDTQATLHHCTNGLHFDAERKVCNWRERANCKFGSTVFPVFPETSTSTTIDYSTNTTPDHTGAWNDMRLTFAAFSVATGQIVNPMYGYDPKHVQCIHRGAYFLPNPYSCQRYFVCAFGHLLPHECGRGTVWSYKRQHCEIANDPTAECYAEIFGDVTTTTTTERTTRTTPTISTTTADPTPTVCYPIYTTGPTGTTLTWTPTFSTFETTTGTSWRPTDSTWHPTGTTWRPTDTTGTTFGTTWKPTDTTGTTWNPTGTTWKPTDTTGTTWNPTGTTWKPTDTTGTTWNPTGTTWKPTDFSGTTDISGSTWKSTGITTVTPTATPRTTATTTKKSDDDFSMNCSDGVKYLADAKDCSHYFICIQEVPVGMFCPEGSYWDYRGEFCTTKAKAQCLVDKSKN